MVGAVAVVAQTAAVMVVAARVVAIKVILLMLVVVQATAQQLVNALAMTAVIKAKVRAGLATRQANQMSVQVASLIKVSVLARQAAAIARAFHVASVLQAVVVVQVAAKVVRRVVLTAVVKVVQTAATVVTTRNSLIFND